MPVRDPLYILTLLCLFVVASEWLARRTPLRHLGAALLVILVTALAANLGLLPAGSSPQAPVPVYDAIFTYLAPLAIFWLLLPVSLRDLARAGLPMLALFGIGAAGVVLGALVAARLVDLASVGPLYPAVAGMYVATYTGGGINFNAVALGYDVVRDGGLFAGAVAVDNVITAVWMVATIALPRLLAPIFGRRGAPEAADAPSDHRLPEPGTEDVERVGPLDVGLVLALGFAAVLAADRVAAALAGAGLQVPSILVLTALALLLAQVPAISRLPGVRVVGMFAVYLFLAVVGAFCDVGKLAALGRGALLLLAFAGVLVLVHGVVNFVAARLLRIDADTAAVASQANVGGSTSALALARSLGRPDLVLPGVLVGALGNALGTFIGFWAAARLFQ